MAARTIALGAWLAAAGTPPNPPLHSAGSTLRAGALRLGPGGGRAAASALAILAANLAARLVGGRLRRGREAGFERFHQIDDARGRRLGHGRRDVLSLHLALDVGLDALADVVVIQRRLERLGRDLVDELARELELGLAHLAVG